jgi:hypothetical protein
MPPKRKLNQFLDRAAGAGEISGGEDIRSDETASQEESESKISGDFIASEEGSTSSDSSSSSERRERPPPLARPSGAPSGAPAAAPAAAQAAESSESESEDVPVNEEDDAESETSSAAESAAAEAVLSQPLAQPPPAQQVAEEDVEERHLYVVRVPRPQVALADAGADGLVSVNITTRTPLPIKKETYQGGNQRQHPFIDDNSESALRKCLSEPNPETPAEELVERAQGKYNFIVEKFGLAENHPCKSLEIILPGQAQDAESLTENKDDVMKLIREANTEVFTGLRFVVWLCIHAKKRDETFEAETKTVREHAFSAYAKYRNVVEQLFVILRHKRFTKAGVYRPDPAMSMLDIPMELMDDSMMNNEEKENDLLMIKDRVRELAKMRRIRRVGKQVFVPVFVPGSGGGAGRGSANKIFAWAYVPDGLVDDWVVRTVEENFGREQYIALEGSKGNANDVKAYFRERGGLQQLDTTRHMLSFRNGVYFVNRDVFIPHEQMSDEKLLGVNVFSCNFIDLPFETYVQFRNCDLPMPTELPQPADDVECVWNIPTPTFDKIMRDQKWTYQLQVCMWVAFGRLLYDQDYLDSEQKAMFCWGRKATGKSTICKIASWIYPHHLVGTCSTRSEQTFGLQAFLGKFIVQNSEVKREWRMDLSDWLKMISGDVVSVAKKFLIPEDVVWRSQFMMAGNEVMGWADDHGAAARRLLIFYFAWNITRSSDLDARLRRELPAIILKANRYYLAAVHMWRAVPFPWPEYFSERRRHFMRNTSLVYKFLCSEHVVYGQGLCVPFDKLIAFFKEVNKSERRGELNGDPNTWMAALEDWRCTMTEDTVERAYGGVMYRDFYIEGVDLRRNQPVALAPASASNGAAGAGGDLGGFYGGPAPAVRST